LRVHIVKKMKNLINFFLLSLIFAGYCSAQAGSNFTIEFNNVVINGGTVYVAIFASAESFRRETPEYYFDFAPAQNTVACAYSLPSGEYVISAYQDANNNGKMDFGLFRIPRELVGISNYFGRGFPSQNFDRQKVAVNSNTDKVIINLYKF